MDSEQIPNNNVPGKINMPEYTREEMTQARSDIASQLNFNEFENQIFEIICSAAREASAKNENIIYYENAWPNVCKYGQVHLIKELYSDVNAQLQTLEVLKKLFNAGYCKIIRGTLDYPVTFSLVDLKPVIPEKDIKSKQTISADLIKDKILGMVEKMVAEVKDTNKPFPDYEKVSENIKKENPNMNLNLINLDQISIKIDCRQFNEKFIFTHWETNRLIQISFEDGSTALLTTNLLGNFLQEFLFPKVMEHVTEDMNLVEKIKVVYVKKSRAIPPIESILENQVSEASFFWISTFYEIMKAEIERLQDKTRNLKHWFIFQIASLLYYYSLNKREVLLKEEMKKNQRAEDRKLIIKKLINDYAEPATLDQLLAYINNITQLEEKYQIEEIEENINIINEPAAKTNQIPVIMSAKTNDKVYYFHKYRFIMMFFHQMEKESKRLTNHFIKLWATSPDLIPRSENKFEDDIKENISEFFYMLIKKNIPLIFSYNNPKDEIIPDEISAKDEIILNTTLSDSKKCKEDYSLFMKSVFVKENISQIKPLYLLLSLNLKDLKKASARERARITPFYKIMFSWFFNILEFFFTHHAIKKKITNAVARALLKAEPVKELNGLVEFFKTHEKLTPGLLDYLRRKVSEAKQSIREGERSKIKSEKELAEEREEMRQVEVNEIKKHFLGNKTLEEKLEEYSRRCFVKLGSAKKESEDAIKGAINAHFRKHKNRHANSTASIVSYASAIVNNNKDIFLEIRDKEALIKYIELLLLGVFIRRISK